METSHTAPLLDGAKSPTYVPWRRGWVKNPLLDDESQATHRRLLVLSPEVKSVEVVEEAVQARAKPWLIKNRESFLNMREGLATELCDELDRMFSDEPMSDKSSSAQPNAEEVPVVVISATSDSVRESPAINPPDISIKQSPPSHLSQAAPPPKVDPLSSRIFPPTNCAPERAAAPQDPISIDSGEDPIQLKSSRAESPIVAVNPGASETIMASPPAAPTSIKGWLDNFKSITLPLIGTYFAQFQNAQLVLQQIMLCYTISRLQVPLPQVLAASALPVTEAEYMMAKEVLNELDGMINEARKSQQSYKTEMSEEPKFFSHPMPRGMSGFKVPIYNPPPNAPADVNLHPPDGRTFTEEMPAGEPDEPVKMNDHTHPDQEMTSADFDSLFRFGSPNEFPYVMGPTGTVLQRPRRNDGPSSQNRTSDDPNVKTMHNNIPPAARPPQNENKSFDETMSDSTAATIKTTQNPVVRERADSTPSPRATVKTPAKTSASTNSKSSVDRNKNPSRAHTAIRKTSNTTDAGVVRVPITTRSSAARSSSAAPDIDLTEKSEKSTRTKRMRAPAQPKVNATGDASASTSAPPAAGRKKRRSKTAKADDAESQSRRNSSSREDNTERVMGTLPQIDGTSPNVTISPPERLTPEIKSQSKTGTTTNQTNNGETGEAGKEDEEAERQPSEPPVEEQSSQGGRRVATKTSFCKVHGEFIKTPEIGMGCPDCANIEKEAAAANGFVLLKTHSSVMGKTYELKCQRGHIGIYAKMARVCEHCMRQAADQRQRAEKERQQQRQQQRLLEEARWRLPHGLKNPTARVARTITVVGEYPAEDPTGSLTVERLVACHALRLVGWEVLGVPRPRSQAQAKVALTTAKLVYKKLVMRVHPDKCNHPQSKEAFHILDAAWKAVQRYQ